MYKISRYNALEGGCDCRQIRYRIVEKPMFTHCCHCRKCQRKTGSAFSVNAILESSNMEMIDTSFYPEMILLPGDNDMKLPVARCANCQVVLWSNHGDLGDKIRFIRVGTLDKPDLLPPDIHIYTSEKQSWVVIGRLVPVMEEDYDWRKFWPRDSLRRWEKVVTQPDLDPEAEFESKTQPQLGPEIASDPRPEIVSGP